MRKLAIASALIALMIPTAATFAADIPVKATPPVAYPYSTAGMYWGITTYASETSFNVNAPGSNSGQLQAIGGSIGGLIGYSMPLAKGAYFGAFEFSAAAQNLNGTSNANGGILSLQGPWRVEAVAKIGMPCANILAMLPANLGNLLPTLPALPSGVAVASNCHAYIGTGAAGEDISASLTPAGARGSEWSTAAIAKTGQIWQLANGYAVETWVEYESNGKSFGVTGGAPMFTPSVQGQAHKMMAGINFLF